MVIKIFVDHYGYFATKNNIFDQFLSKKKFFLLTDKIFLYKNNVFGHFRVNCDYIIEIDQRFFILIGRQ